jgi:hypothetical protein
MWNNEDIPLRRVSHRSIPAAQQVVLQVGGHELLTLHADRFVTWRFDRAGELSSKSMVHEYLLGVGGVWKIFKDCGSFDRVAIANR